METLNTSDAVIDFDGIFNYPLNATDCKTCELYYPELLAELQFISEVYVDDTHHINFFLQDQLMEKVFENYHQYLLIDISTYIPKLDRFLALFVGMDCNGQCSIVSMGLIKSGNMMGLMWTISIFKKRNEQSANTIVILADLQNILDRVYDFFPNTFTCTSFFLCLEQFQKDLCELNNALVNQDEILELFINLFSVPSELQYMELLKKMERINVDVYNIFMKKWNKLRKSVAARVYIDSRVFLKTFHKFLKGVTEKLSLALENLDSLEQVIRNIHSTIYNLRVERFEQIREVSHSPTAPYFKVPVMQEYSNFLTPFASKLVYEQLQKSEDIKNVENISHQTYKVDESHATSNSCCCTFHYVTKLPCCHIFSVRKLMLLPKVVEWVGPEWNLASYRDTVFSMHSAYVSNHNESQVDGVMGVEARGQKNRELSEVPFHCEENEPGRSTNFHNISEGLESDFDVTEIRSDSREQADEHEAFKNIPIDDYMECYELNKIDIENAFMDIAYN